MKSKYFLIIYFVLAAMELYSEIGGFITLKLYTKPLLMPTLFAYYYFSSKGLNIKIQLPIILALLLSLVGDIFLLHANKDPWFFLGGLIAFTLTHVFYIYLCKPLKFDVVLFKTKPFFILPIVFVCGVFLYFGWNRMGDMKLPVIIYCLVLVCLNIYALNLINRVKKVIFNLIWIGTSLFILSDLCIGVNKFILPFPCANFFIMLLYIIAQWLIVLGFTLKKYYHEYV